MPVPGFKVCCRCGCWLPPRAGHACDLAVDSSLSATKNPPKKVSTHRRAPAKPWPRRPERSNSSVRLRARGRRPRPASLRESAGKRAGGGTQARPCHEPLGSLGGHTSSLCARARARRRGPACCGVRAAVRRPAGRRSQRDGAAERSGGTESSLTARAAMPFVIPAC